MDIKKQTIEDHRRIEANSQVNRLKKEFDRKKKLFDKRETEIEELKSRINKLEKLNEDTLYDMDELSEKLHFLDPERFRLLKDNGEDLVGFHDEVRRDHSKQKKLLKIDYKKKK